MRLVLLGDRLHAAADCGRALPWQVAQLREEASSQAQLLTLMAKESCKNAAAGTPPNGNRLRASEFERWTSEVRRSALQQSARPTGQPITEPTIEMRDLDASSSIFVAGH